MNYNINHNKEQHPEHPVRNVLFCICCLFFSLAFSYVWVWELIEFEYTTLALALAATILLATMISLIVSFKKSHSRFFAYKRARNKKRRGKQFEW